MREQAPHSLVRVDALLARARSVETLEAAYAAWDELRAGHAEALAHFAQEAGRLEGQGAFLLGAVRSAAGPEPEAPTPDAAAEGLALPAELSGFLRQAEEGLHEARAALAEAQEAEAAAYARATEALVGELTGRLSRQVGRVRPVLVLMHRPLAGGRAILHLGRLTGDAPALVLFLLTGAIPTHYGYLEDEATDAVGQGPTHLYPEEGVPASALRPTAGELAALLLAKPQRLPVRACLPFWVAEETGPVLWRMVPRGPVLELERAEGERFQPVVEGRQAERAAGALLRLKLAGKVELELEQG